MRIWKNWPYWLRCGIITGTIALGWVILWYSCEFGLFTPPSSRKISAGFECLLLFLPIMPAGMVIDKILANIPLIGIMGIAKDEPFILFCASFATVIVCFAVGAVIGWLYGKIKNRGNRGLNLPITDQ